MWVQEWVPAAQHVDSGRRLRRRGVRAVRDVGAGVGSGGTARGSRPAAHHVVPGQRPSVERRDGETRAGAAQGGCGRAGGVLRRSRQCLHRSARPEVMWGRAR
jgi:hypothetical protein